MSVEIIYNMDIKSIPKNDYLKFIDNNKIIIPDKKWLVKFLEERDINLTDDFFYCPYCGFTCNINDFIFKDNQLISLAVEHGECLSNIPNFEDDLFIIKRSLLNDGTYSNSHTQSFCEELLEYLDDHNIDYIYNIENSTFGMCDLEISVANLSKYENLQICTQKLNKTS